MSPGAHLTFVFVLARLRRISPCTLIFIESHFSSFCPSLSQAQDGKGKNSAMQREEQKKTKR
jgi:hypothetical protein